MQVRWNSFKSKYLLRCNLPRHLWIRANRSYRYETMKDFLRKGYCLHADNIYNSVALTKQMGIDERYVCGILRAERRGNPKKVVKAKLKKEEMIQRSKDGISMTN